MSVGFQNCYFTPCLHSNCLCLCLRLLIKFPTVASDGWLTDTKWDKCAMGHANRVRFLPIVIRQQGMCPATCLPPLLTAHPQQKLLYILALEASWPAAATRPTRPTTGPAICTTFPCLSCATASILSESPSLGQGVSLCIGPISSWGACLA